MGATVMLAKLAAELGRPLRPTLAWEYPTPSELAIYLADGDRAQDVSDSSLAGSDRGRTNRNCRYVVSIPRGALPRDILANALRGY
jgi:hypothetical protein